MSAKLETLGQNLEKHLGERIKSKKLALGELTIEVSAGDYLEVMKALRDEAELRFDEVADLCGVDYSAYGNGERQGLRYAVVVHLLSVANNLRLRVRVFADNDDFPSVPSITELWASANWFEREAFDLYGIVFPGHNDLRRILTDYGFIGHPFRKDFPISGYVEMRYDPDQRRVIYQPVTIEPRENTPRIVREETYGDL
ncbi:MAG: NADH-quinone oxidoreductase subunit [Pseudomonadota bacterium]|jgi:NADH-quinone oxidoreductase subunit C|nr:NADH-quinone oxidoreductase subunit [Pseudomonadota bacterium]MDQ5904229.1 NADH-quinone oxidoreductase subunit [Pseudomonadota bacterium]MDQ5915622.1 NADH-quinone oxidoreductase subunit [Pseudomonadota bacterium]MDQ5942439.1 NADH-quinone oxidoreductase subunit [Pseudomonadota bacterium]